MSLTGPISHSKGYTLLELLVALGFIALMAVLIPTLFTGFLPGFKMKAEADEISTALVELRNEARLTGQTQAFLPEKTIEGGINIALAPHPDFPDFGLEQIEFYPNGRSSGGVVLLSIGERERTVEVDWLTGQVREVSGE